MQRFSDTCLHHSVRDSKCPCIKREPEFGNSCLIWETRASSSWSVILEYKAVTLKPNPLILRLTLLKLTPRTSAILGHLKHKCRRCSSCSCVISSLDRPLTLSWNTAGTYPHSFRTLCARLSSSSKLRATPTAS